MRGDARTDHSRADDDDFWHVRGTSIALDSRMRLQPIDVYILDYFRRNARARIDPAELAAQCRTSGTDDVEAALLRLEREAHMVRRKRLRREWLELTREGRKVAGLGAAGKLQRLGGARGR